MRNHSSLPLQKLESDAYRCCGRDRCHSGGFLLRIMPPSWHPVPACTPRLRCRRANFRCRDEEENRTRIVDSAGSGATPAAFYLGLCRLHGILSPPAPNDFAAGGQFFCAGDNPCSDSQVYPMKSRIAAMLRMFLGKILQRLPSLTPEIRNHCSRGVVAFCRRNHSPSRQRKLESDADLVATTTVAGETILLRGNES